MNEREILDWLTLEAGHTSSDGEENNIGPRGQLRRQKRSVVRAIEATLLLEAIHRTHPAAQRPTSGDCKLLGLPAEIRVRILEWVVKEAEKGVTRDIDKRRLAPLLKELAEKAKHASERNGTAGSLPA